MKQPTDRPAEADFTAFVAERGPALIRIAYALTGDQRSAEDLVQGALAKAYVRWSRISDHAEAYVRRIIYHDRISGWRRVSYRAEISVSELPDVPDGAGQDHDVAVRLILRDALRALPPRQRAVLVLRYLEDRSVEETAEVLGCRPGTVASQASRALKKLKQLIPAATEVLR